MKIYTKTGDKGTTGLRGGHRVSKDHPRVGAYGDVDELNAFIGIALASLKTPALRRDLSRIQAELFAAGAVLSDPNAKDFPAVSELWLEERIDQMERKLPPLRNFILPGGTRGAADLHVCRTVCRRAERSTIKTGPPAVIVYLNRLSDFLFVAARWANRKARRKETLWKGQP